MNNGDALYIVLDYKVDGEPIQEGQFDEIEFSIGDKYAKNSVRFLFSNGDISWDPNLEKYTLFITQRDTLKLSSGVNTYVEYQVRLRKDDVVISSPVETLQIGRSVSKQVI